MHLSISQLSELTGRERRRIAKQLKDLQYTAREWGATLYGISRGAAARLCRGHCRSVKGHNPFDETRISTDHDL
jgi:hypothetical protein